MNEMIYWLWLSMAVTPGSSAFRDLYQRYPNVKVIYELDRSDYVRILGSKSKDITALSDKNTDKAEEILEYCERKNIGLLTYGSPQYPSNLRKISNPPVLLYYRGVLPDFEKLFCVCTVGTRRLSDYGKRNAFNISFDLAKSGATIVSGMAIGIDGVSHAAAIAAEKPTIAFLGTGIDVCYPKQHQRLAREIVKTGCIFTEYPPGTQPNKPNFPIRNRLISGISDIALIIEGKARSGALWSARHAEEQGRVVYAMPGNVGNINSELPNLLIKNGARLCSCADDIVRDFADASLGKLNPFEMPLKNSVNMEQVISQLAVSCVTIDDRIFRHSRTAKRSFSNEEIQSESSLAEQTANKEEKPKSISMVGFDKTAIKIYQKIPREQECKIETLIDDELPLRVIMKGLLQLEMAKLVDMLPGEKVRRKF